MQILCIHRSFKWFNCKNLPIDRIFQHSKPVIEDVKRTSFYPPLLQERQRQLQLKLFWNILLACIQHHIISIIKQQELIIYPFLVIKTREFLVSYNLHIYLFNASKQAIVYLYSYLTDIKNQFYQVTQQQSPYNIIKVTPNFTSIQKHSLKSDTCSQYKTVSNLQNQNTIIEFDLQSFQIIHMADIIPDYNSSDEDEKPKEVINKKDQGANLTGWNELFLKDQLKRAIRQCGFEHPSEVQVEAIPLALQGQDILCQAKSGMGKTAVFVISILNQINPDGDNYQPHQAIITCHTRQLAHQIFKDFKRLGRYFKKPELRYGCYFGGVSLQENQAQLKDPAKTPHIIISTPGRLYDLAKHKLIHFDKCKFFVVDECDKVLGNPKMRADIQDIFIKTPHHKQVMMFSATMPEEMKKDCKKFLQKESEIFIDEGKLILHGLAQFYVYINENKKFEKLTHLLDTLAFNQMIIFVNRVDRAKKLTELLRQKLFNPICIHSQLKQEERIKNYDLFKANGSRLLVATDLFGRGIDIERVNLVINYDFPTDRDTYLHRVGRAGRFGTKGLAINFIRADEQENEEGGTDKSILMDVQNGFKVKISELPKELDTSLYM